MAAADQRHVVFSCRWLIRHAADETGAMADLLDLLEHGLSFRWESGDVTPIQRSQSTGWRVLPSITFAQVPEGAALVQLDGGVRARIGDGDAFVVAPGVRHMSTVATARAISRWCHFEVRAFDG